MNSFKTLTATMALAMVLGLASLSTAQMPTQAPVEVKPAGILTQESLKPMLINLGFEPREEKVGNVTINWITLERGGLRYEVNVNISSNGENVWASVPLADLPKEGNVSPVRLMKLLELNSTTVGPAHFIVAPSLNRVFLNRHTSNRGMTPKLLKEHIERTVGLCDSTKDHWNHNDWTGTKLTAVQK